MFVPNTKNHHIDDYFKSRESFKQLAEEKGFKISSFPIDEQVENEELTIDLAVKHPIKEKKELIGLTSGIHGVEGPVGAAAQRQFLAEHYESLEKFDDVGFLLVHAINPFGFLHGRRVNENRVDLNRNFLDSFDNISFTENEVKQYLARANILMPSVSKEYSALRVISGLVKEIALSEIKSLFNKSTEKTFIDKALEGQYNFPEGLFYGGRESQPSAKILKKIIQTETQGYQKAVFLDLHSGLDGPKRMHCSTEHLTNSREYQILEYIDKAIQGSTDNNNTHMVKGSVEAALQMYSKAQTTATMTVEHRTETGIIGKLKIANALLEESWAYRRFGLNHPAHIAASALLSEKFNPNNQERREQMYLDNKELFNNLSHYIFASQLARKTMRTIIN